MNRAFAIAALVVLIAQPSRAQQAAPSVPLGAGRPETPGVTRTQLRDDAKTTVVRVHFEPGAKEPPHTHPYDVILVPVVNASVDFNIGGKTVTTFKTGEAHFIPRDTTHYLANASSTSFEVITVAVK